MSRAIPRIYLKATRKDGFKREGLFTEVNTEITTSNQVWVKAGRLGSRFPDEFICEEIETKVLSVEEAEAWKTNH